MLNHSSRLVPDAVSYCVVFLRAVCGDNAAGQAVASSEGSVRNSDSEQTGRECGRQGRATNYFLCKINLTKSNREVQLKKFIASISNITALKRYCCWCCDHAACQEVLPLFETLHVRDQRLQIIRRQIDGWHAAGVHFRGGMFENFG
jgi:hypothetical protein